MFTALVENYDQTFPDFLSVQIDDLFVEIKNTA